MRRLRADWIAAVLALALAGACGDSGSKPRRRGEPDDDPPRSAQTSGTPTAKGPLELGSAYCGLQGETTKEQVCQVSGALSPFALRELQKPNVLKGATLKLDGKVASAENIARLVELGPTLESLDLDLEKGTKPSLEGLRKLTSLKRLEIGYRSESYGAIEIGDSLAPLADLKNLRSLRILGARLPNLSFASGLALEELFLGGCSIRAVDGIAGLTTLRQLRLDSVVEAAWPGLDAVRGLTALESLSLNTDSKDCQLGWVGELPNLTSVTMSSYRCDDDFDLTSIAKAPKLEKLRLSGVNVKSYAPLAGTPGLKDLHTESTEGWKDLEALATLPNLTTAYFSDSKLKDMGVVSPLTQLVTLEVYSSETPENLEALGKLKKLQTLRLTMRPKTPVADLPFLTELGALKTLEVGRGLVDRATLDALQKRFPALSIQTK